MRTRRAPAEIDETLVAEPGALPDAERCIELDRRRREPVFECCYVNDRLERRPGLAKRLDRAIVARSDDVESALHGKNPARVNFFGDHAAGNDGDRAKLI